MVVKSVVLYKAILLCKMVDVELPDDFDTWDEARKNKALRAVYDLLPGGYGDVREGDEQFHRADVMGDGEAEYGVDAVVDNEGQCTVIPPMVDKND